MKKIAVIFVIVIALLFSITILGNRYLSKPDSTEITQDNSDSEDKSSIVIEESNSEENNLGDADNQRGEVALPEKVLLDVAFVPQAPFQKWDALHEDACEEASLLNVKHFLDKDKTVSKELAEKEIQDMVNFEKKNGYKLSITLDELNDLADKYYEMRMGRVEKNVTVDEIKKELSDGKPVIVGAAGKVLPNPNFRNGGPNYHMLVVIGYDDKGFITNDPGTRLGKSFRYTFNGLYKSIHDWDPKNILNGGRDYLVFD